MGYSKLTINQFVAKPCPSKNSKNDEPYKNDVKSHQGRGLQKFPYMQSDK
jgi:hypothetical protein